MICVVSTLIAVWARGGLDNFVAQASFTYKSGAGLGPEPMDSDADSYAEVPGFDKGAVPDDSGGFGVYTTTFFKERL